MGLETNQGTLRKLGDYWSDRFAEIMQRWFGIHKFDKTPSPVITLPNKTRIILPDVMLFERYGENYYCEVKHKVPNVHGNYGLEKYRFDSLVNMLSWAKGTILYVIHDYESIGRDSKINRLEDWYCADIKRLSEARKQTFPGQSIVNGEYKRVPIHYWSACEWNLLYLHLGKIGEY